MSNTDAMMDEALNYLNSGVEQLAICNLQQEAIDSNSCTNEGEITPATDIQQVASPLELFPENETNKSSDTILREATSTFESLTQLALELRLVIWGLACSRERLLEITTHPTEISFDLGAPTPSVLFVNHESREEAEKHYKKDNTLVILMPIKMVYFELSPSIPIKISLTAVAQNTRNSIGNLMACFYIATTGVLDVQLQLRCINYSMNSKLPNIHIEIPQDILDALAYRKEQKVCIEEMQSVLQEENRKNPACPTPVVEFEISVQAPLSALESPTSPPDSVSG